MSVEYTIVCDGCAGIIEASGVSAANARKVVREQLGGVQRGRLDYCAACVKQKLDRRWP